MSLHYLVKHEMLIGHVLPLSCYKKTLEFIPSQLWPPNLPDLDSVDNSTWEILQEKVYKTSITDLELSMMPLTNGCHNADMAQLSPLRSQSLFQFVHISDEYVVHILLQYSPHTVLNCIQLWQIWGPQLKWDKF